MNRITKYRFGTLQLELSYQLARVTVGWCTTVQ